MSQREGVANMHEVPDETWEEGRFGLGLGSPPWACIADESSRASSSLSRIFAP